MISNKLDRFHADFLVVFHSHDVDLSKIEGVHQTVKIELAVEAGLTSHQTDARVIGLSCPGRVGWPCPLQSRQGCPGRAGM